MERRRIETLCIHGGTDSHNSTGAVAVPVYQSATFAHPGPGRSTGYDYSRLQNPTREAVENTVAALEGGHDAMAFSSGMAAMTVLCELFSPGDHIIASGDLYGGSVRLLDNIVRKRGVDVTYLDTGDGAKLKNSIGPSTRAVFVETPTNPMMNITDIGSVADLCSEKNLLLIVDNTFLTPVYQRPLELGADIVLHSGTKYLGGHNDTLAGFLVTSGEELTDRLRYLYKTMGACLAPWDSFLIQRGIKTLALRMARITRNAQEIVLWLEGRKQVTKVLYPGLSGMISFRVESGETVNRILTGIKTIQYAESLGGVESLITYPLSQTHADVPPHVREALGIDDCLLRFSVGIEAVQDLIADLEGVLP